MTLPLPLMLLLAALLTTASMAQHPILPVSLRDSDAGAYRRLVEPVMALDEASMLAVIPTQSGLYFTDCPNCTSGLQEGQFQGGKDAKYEPWSLARPEAMRCAYCGHQYPSEQYPMTEVLRVHNPRGEVQEYPYWVDADGYRHYFGARIDYHRIRYMETAARNLARAYYVTHEAPYARRCALILQRFAEVFPGYCYHFDYPFREKVIYDGPVAPESFRPGFRTARWTWWAYGDVPDQLVEAYDLIHGSGELEKLSAETGHDVEAEIVSFFTMAVEQVLANQDDLGNMSPGMWTDIIRAGRVLGRPEWVHECVGRLERFVDTGFFGDGTWSEGAPSYHAQVVGNLARVLVAARGHSDPPGYKHPVTGRRFDDLDLTNDLPGVRRAKESLELMRLPNGRYVPVHDTWWGQKSAAMERSRPVLLPALGHGILAGGEGQGQWQAHLTWSPGMGHQHHDGLSLLLFAQGQELLSDLGYTHSRDRAWTLPTLAHNTVVVDSQNQTADRSTFGSLRCYAVWPDCQVVSVDNPTVYPGLTDTYRRTLLALTPPDAPPLLVDLFEVTGGQTHDYLLHGCADVAGTLTPALDDPALTTRPLATLLSPDTAFVEAADEGECGITLQSDCAYGYLRDLRQVAGALPPVVTLDHALADTGVRLRVHLLAEPGDELVLGCNPAVRGAKENDDNLRDFWRPFALMRRTGGRSLFATVVEPRADAGVPVTVRRLDWPRADLALEIAAEGWCCLVLLRPNGLQADWDGRSVQATAELAAVWVNTGLGGMVVDGEVSCGDHAISAPGGRGAPLVAVDRAAQSLTVAGELLPPTGAVVLLDHAGQRTSAFTVVHSERVPEGSRLTVAEDPGFAWDAAAQQAEFICQPRETFTGPHLLRATPVSYFHVRDAG